MTLAGERTSQGEPPTEDCEREWYRMERTRMVSMGGAPCKERPCMVSMGKFHSRTGHYLGRLFVVAAASNFASLLVAAGGR